MADDRVQDLLKIWGMESLINDFKENQIDSTALQDLTEDLIKELIPKIGCRIKFMRKWEQHFKGRSGENSPHVSNVSETNQIKRYTPNEVEGSDTNSNTDDESTSSSNLALHTLAKQNHFVGRSQFKKESKKSCVSVNVKKLLKSTAAGRCVLKCSRNLPLPKATRKLLVDLIATEALQNFSGYKCPVQVDFEDITHQIKELFPKENVNSYYIAPVKKRSSRIETSVTAKGKLVDKYRNKLQAYRRLSGCDVSYESSTSESVRSDTISDEVQSSQLWLEHNREPWDAVLKHWEISAPLRLDTAKNNIETVHSYLEKWPILRHSNGHVLLELDYKYLHKNANHGVFLYWDKFFSHIQNSRSISREGAAKSLLDLLKLETLSADCKVVVQLMLLSYFVAPRGRLRLSKKEAASSDTEYQTNRRKQQWKFSITECQKSMILHVKLAGDLLMVQQQRIDEVLELGLTVQPYMIVVGPTLESIEAFYVSLDSTLYKVPTALKALDLCFKSFHAVNALYPPESEHLWYLIQFAVYKITTKWDKQISYIADIVGSVPDFEK